MANDKLNIAVLLSTFNGSKYFSEFIASLKDAAGVVKKIAEVTLYIRDDGSNKLFLDELLRFGELNKSWVIIKTKENIGSALSFMALIKDVPLNYDLYFFADQDDIWLPGKINAAIEKIRINEPMIYASSMHVVSSDLSLLKITAPPKCLNKLNSLNENALTGCTIAFNNKMMQMLKVSENTKAIVMHDAWVYLLGTFLGSIYYDKESYILYRQHSSNVVGYNNSFIKRIVLFSKKVSNKNKNKNNFYWQAIEFYGIYKSYLSSEDKKIVENYFYYLNCAGLKGAYYLIKNKFKSNGGFMVTLIILFKTMIGYGL